MIEVAAILSVAVKHWPDFYIIMFLLVANAVIDYWNEHKASSALDALKSQLAMKARALRDGQWNEIEARDLVPEDVIRIRLGDVIPADATLVDGEYLSVDQAALTGESLPVSRKVGDQVYSGSIAKQGEMIARVDKTGSNTFFGKTAKLVEGAGNVSHFQQTVMQIGNFLIVLSVGLSIVLTCVQLVRGAPFLELLQFVLILVIASIPVAMPTVLSVTMALGAVALARQKAIVSKLQSIEELAGVDILCSDKTGTLTKNQLSLGDPILFEAASPEQCVIAGALASKIEDHDAIDTAIVGALDDPSTLKSYEILQWHPFDPVNKRTEVKVQMPDGSTSYFSKGAPQVVLDLCSPDPELRKQAETTVNHMAQKGFRTLSVASSTDKQTWKLLGILPLFDPPRDDSAETIQNAKELGLSVKMITGDNLAIGTETSGQLGMGTHLVAAKQAFPKDMDPDNVAPEMGEAIEKADGFAEVFPEHKYAIVKSLQKRQHYVGMTGDGVNDAPALKQADVGIAVSGATDAARAAADLILTAPGLSTVIRAIELSRQIFQRMMSYTIYRVAMTIDIMFFVTLSMIFFNFTPLSALMIVLLTLLDDIPIMAIAYDNAVFGKKTVAVQDAATLHGRLGDGLPLGGPDVWFAGRLLGFHAQSRVAKVVPRAVGHLDDRRAYPVDHVPAVGRRWTLFVVPDADARTVLQSTVPVVAVDHRDPQHAVCRVCDVWFRHPGSDIDLGVDRAGLPLQHRLDVPAGLRQAGDLRVFPYRPTPEATCAVPRSNEPDIALAYEIENFVAI